MKCAKCQNTTEKGSTYFEGGNSYRFCETCTKILETFPIPTNIMHIFLSPKDKQSQITKNIFEARKRRTEGKSLWVDK